MKSIREIKVGDFCFKTSENSIYLSRKRGVYKIGEPIEEYITFLEKLVSFSDKVDYLISDKAYIISPHYRLVLNYDYIFLGKVNIDDWNRYEKNTLDYKEKYNLIININTFFRYSPLW